MPLARVSSNKENALCRPAAAVRAKAAKAKAGLAAGLGLGLPSRRHKRSTSVQRAKAANSKPKPKPKAPHAKPQVSHTCTTKHTPVTSAGYIKLPRALARPTLPPLAELELDGNLIPAAYVLEALQPLLSGLLLAAALFQMYPGACEERVEGRRAFAFGLPRAHAHLDVGGLAPDLCLALTRPGGTEALQVYPVHRLVYAAQCAYFPTLPLSSPRSEDAEARSGLATIAEDASVCSSAASSDAGSDGEVSDGEVSGDGDSDSSDSASEASAALHTPAYVQLPVLSLEVPSPETWELVHVRLHSSDGYCWQRQLLGVPAASPGAARRALGALGADELLRRMRRVHGAWQNCCALGVTNAKVWEQLASAWAVITDAISARASS